MEVRIRPEEELTELAKHYGEDKRPQLMGTKKSGVTPVDPLPPAGPALSVEDWEIRKLIEATQKKKLVGFTARELKAMGALAYFEPAKASNISSPVHPVFRNWESSEAKMRRHNPMLPLGKGREGYWELFNPLIEPVLVPCLRLATQFIDNCHMWTWWDTLCFGELRPIHPERKSLAGDILYSIHPRDPMLAHMERDRTKERFADLASHLTWALAHGKTDPLNGHPIELETGWQGVTLSDPVTKSLRCCLDTEKIEALLRTDLTTAERLLLQWSVAKTAVHELAHAMWRLNTRGQRKTGNLPEPYFDTDVAVELGNSLINRLMGGREVGITSYGIGYSGQLYLTVCMVPYPSWRDNTKKYPLLGKVESLKHSDYFPVPIEYFERIQQEDFWNCHIQVFGTRSAHMGPLVHGRRFNSSILPAVPPINEQQIVIMGDACERDVVAVNMENQRRLKAGAVRRALEASITAERCHDEEKLNESQQTGNLSSIIKTLSVGFELDSIGWANDLAENSDQIEEPEDYNEPARFSEIAAFLTNHRQVLALDTMIYPIPENTFFEYITRLGQISITREELRAFLIYANFTNKLFIWDKGGLGMVKRRNEGWDPAALEPPRRFTEPPEEHKDLMKDHMSKFWGVYTVRGLRELDEDLALHYFNHNLTDELTKEQYGNLIDWCDHHKRWWVRGPPGIVRCTVPVPKKHEAAKKKREEEAQARAREEKRLRKRQERRKRRLDEDELKAQQEGLEGGGFSMKGLEAPLDPDDAVAKRRKISTVLQGVENRENVLLGERGESEDDGDPMDWKSS